MWEEMWSFHKIDYMREGTKFKSSATNQEYYINQPVSYELDNIIYLATCNKCSLQ